MRRTNKRQMYQVPGEAYAVAQDILDNEISIRHPGTLWIAFRNNSIEALFVDEMGGRSSTFEVNRKHTVVTAVGVFLDDQLVCSIPIQGARPEDNASVDWGPMYDAMD